ncbi:MAG: hypothetical protein KatS3mg061_1842 [Dehalococcoidia bacterium]|nr:MAG: hypothetical protein KatS3mg061_1842 [Dehalococcoidia bacterium]
MKVSQEPVSLETPVGEEEDSHLGDFIEDRGAVPRPDAASRQLLREQVEAVLGSLTGGSGGSCSFGSVSRTGGPGRSRRWAGSSTSPGSGSARSRRRRSGSCAPPAAANGCAAISTDDFPARLARALAERQRGVLPTASRQGLREGAVLLLLRATPAGYVIVCTRRTDAVATHKGQIALPGGAREPGDATLWETALREAREEIGIAPATVQYLGVLDDLATTSGYALTPFVGRLTSEPRYVPQPREVAEVFEVALAQLLDPASQTNRPLPAWGSHPLEPGVRGWSASDLGSDRPGTGRVPQRGQRPLLVGYPPAER